MNFVKALFATAALLASSVGFAADEWTTTYCNVGTVSTDRGQVNVTLNVDSKFDPAAAYVVALAIDNGTGEEATIAGFQAKVVKASKFDTFKKGNCAWAHCYSTTTRVFPVKVELSADESIGFEIVGDVGMPVKKLVNYGVCYENTTRSTTH